MSKNKMLSKKQLEYLEASVYILAIIVVIFANVYGNIYIKMIPFLLILGVVGKLLFKRSITTTVFSMLVAMCIIHIKMRVGFIENLMLSAFLALDVAMGELLGECIKKLYNSYKKKKNVNVKTKSTSMKKYVKAWLVFIVVFIVTILINSYINGNALDLAICKATVNEYLNTNYDNNNFTIKEIKYTFGVDRHYSFFIENNLDGNISKYIVYLKNKDVVIDEYKSNILEKNNNIINQELKEYINDLNKYKEFNISAEYIDEKNLRVSIKEKVNQITDIEKEEFAKQIVDFLEDIKKFSKYSIIEELVITIDNVNNKQDIVSSSIYLKGYENNIKTSGEEPYKYILKSLMIEYISY